MALVKMEGISRSIADFFILLFIYTVNGTPFGDKPESREIKHGYLTYYKSDSLGKDAEATFHWPRGVVQYLFDNSSYDVMLKDKLRLSMTSLEKESCVRFKELTQKPTRNTSSWLHFTNKNKERECFHSPVHQQNGEIQVILGYDCLKQSEITHALMHGLGFRDEITHPNRDSYVKILWNNIQPAYWKLFGRHVTDDPGQLSEYDTRSIMHFHDHAFSANGQATISGLIPGLKIAPSENLSHLDKMKLGLKFGHECNKRKVGELLETCQDIFSKNKNVSSNEADYLKPISQNGTVSIDKMNSDEHNVIILGRDKKGKSDNKNSSNSFNVDPSEPGNNDDQSEECEIPQEPRMDFEYENGPNEEPQMDYQYYDNETDENDKNSKKLDEDNEDGNHKVFDGNLGSDNNKNDKENEEELRETVSPPKLNSDSDGGDTESADTGSENTNKGNGNIAIFNNNKKLRPNSKNIAVKNNTNTISGNNNQINNFFVDNSETDIEDGNHKVSDRNSGSDNNKDDQENKEENEEELSNDGSENVSPPKLNSDSDSGDNESKNTNKGNGNIAIFNNNKKIRPNSKNIADQNDTKLSNKKNVQHVNITNNDDVNIFVIGHHNKLRPNSKNISAKKNTNTISGKNNQINNFIVDNSKTSNTDSEDGNHKVSDRNSGSDNNKHNNENEEDFSSDYSENVSPPKLNFDSDSGDNESENTNKGNGNIAIFNNNKKIRPNSKNIADQNDTKLSNKKNVQHVNITNNDDVNIFVIGHHNKLRPNSKNISAKKNTNTISGKNNQINNFIVDNSKTSNTDSEDGNHKVSDRNSGSDNNKHNNENEEDFSSDYSENVSPPKLNFDSDSGDNESENTNKGNGNIAIFNNNKKSRPYSKNIAAQNDTKLSIKQNVTHANITRDLANGDTETNNVHRDKIKLAYANMTDTSDTEDDNNVGDTNDNSEGGGNIAIFNNNKKINESDGNFVVFNNNKKRPKSKNMAAQNNTKISNVKSAKHVNIPNKDNVNIFVVGHHNKVRPHSKNITRELANGDPGTNNVRLTEDKIKFAYADISDTSDPEDDKNINDSKDNNDNDANNTDDNKVI